MTGLVFSSQQLIFPNTARHKNSGQALQSAIKTEDKSAIKTEDKNNGGQARQKHGE
jgi:hypothetical protein